GLAVQPRTAARGSRTIRGRDRRVAPGLRGESALRRRRNKSRRGALLLEALRRRDSDGARRDSDRSHVRTDALLSVAGAAGDGPGRSGDSSRADPPAASAFAGPSRLALWARRPPG